MFFGCIVLTISAVPALPGQWKTLVLADGTMVYAELCGDEYLNYWQTEDGQKYVENVATGYFELADIDALTISAASRRAAVEKKISSRSRVALGEPTNYNGQKKGLILLVQFTDLSFDSSHTVDLYQRIANEENFTDDLGFIGSVKDYFRDQSYGQFEIDFDVFGTITMPQGYAYYGRDTDGYYVNPQGMVELVTLACEAADAVVDFNDYDWDHDGEADLVFILYAGQGQNAGGNSNTIWPHMSTISSLNNGKTITLDNVVIDTYACSCELSRSMGIDGIGTICHEFSHCLGIPDMYDLYQGRDHYTMGNWDVLCYGNYNGHSYGDGFIPAGFTSFERWFAGWLEPTELTANVGNMPPLTEAAEAYVVYNDRSKNECYFLENRNQTGWDAGTAGSGLLILHVDYDKALWQENLVNSLYTEHYTLFAANNDRSEDGEVGHPYPFGDNNSLTNTSLPAATLNTANIDGTTYMNKPITNITRNDDGTVSFSFANDNTASPTYTTPKEYVFYESFDKCEGVGGNDGVFEGDDIGLVDLSGYTDNEPWTYSTFGFSGYQCAVFGVSIIPGEVVSPEITIEQDAYLLFNAAPYAGDGYNLTLSVASGDVSLGERRFILREEQMTTYGTSISGSGTFTLRFTADNRFFLDEVYVTYDNTSGINDILSGGKLFPNNRVYTLDGRYLGNDINKLHLKKGVYIVGGKKIVI